MKKELTIEEGTRLKIEKIKKNKEELKKEQRKGWALAITTCITTLATVYFTFNSLEDVSKGEMPAFIAAISIILPALASVMGALHTGEYAIKTENLKDLIAKEEEDIKTK